MKKLQLLLATLVCSLVFVSTASADLVQFYVFDAPGMTGDGQVSLSLSTYTFPKKPGSTLQYALNNETTWQNVTGNTLTLNGLVNLVKFQLIFLGDTLTDGNIIFDGADNGGSYFNSATIEWLTGDPDASFAVTVGTTSNNDKVSPVPVPPAAYLLASGVIGIITMRRKKAADQA